MAMNLGDLKEQIRLNHGNQSSTWKDAVLNKLLNQLVDDLATRHRWKSLQSVYSLIPIGEGEYTLAIPSTIQWLEQIHLAGTEDELITGGTDMDDAYWLDDSTPETNEQTSYHDGVWNCRHLSDSTPSSGGFYYGSQDLELTLGDTYCFGYKLKIISGTINAIVYSGAGVITGGSDAGISGYSSWTRRSKIFKSILTTSEAWPVFQNASSSVAAEFYVDEVSLRKLNGDWYKVNIKKLDEFRSLPGEYGTPVPPETEGTPENAVIIGSTIYFDAKCDDMYPVFIDCYLYPTEMTDNDDYPSITGIDRILIAYGTALLYMHRKQPESATSWFNLAEMYLKNHMRTHHRGKVTLNRNGMGI